MTPEHTIEAAIGLGSNLGDRLDRVQKGITGLSRSRVSVVAVSRVFETRPIGPDQPAFLNAVAIVRTPLSPRDLLVACQRIEAEQDRQRLEHWGPRTLDLDILDIVGVSSASDDLRIPHPMSHLRGFVLVPWADVAPQWIHPATGTSVGDMAASVSWADEGIVLREDLALVVP